MSTIRSNELELSRALLDILMETPGVTVYGIMDNKWLEEGVPTCAFTLKGKSTRQVAEELDQENIYVWDGNYYALEVTTRLGLEDSGGMVRVGPVPQNRWFTTCRMKLLGLLEIWRRLIKHPVSCYPAISPYQGYDGQRN